LLCLSTADRAVDTTQKAAEAYKGSVKVTLPDAAKAALANGEAAEAGAKTTPKDAVDSMASPDQCDRVATAL
jgi:hypothetical protein